MGKLLLIAGLIIAAVGLLMMMGLPIGRLPGDIAWRRGNATFYFTDDLDLTVGARYAKNEQEADSARSGVLYGIFGDPVTSHFSLDDNATTYLAALRWRQSEDLSWFLRAASGYRPGGPPGHSQWSARPKGVAHERDRGPLSGRARPRR